MTEASMVNPVAQPCFYVQRLIMANKIQAENIEPMLKQLAVEAEAVNPALADKLKNLCRWIKGKSPGKLREKKYVAAVLTQLINDIRAWLVLNELSDNDREIVFSQKSPAQRYWFESLLPEWFANEDKYLPNWKQKLMQGKYEDDDEPFRNVLIWQIKERKGNTLWRYLLDLSMATDLIVNHTQNAPLCIQYTKSSEDNTAEKRDKWEKTLRYWGIERGIFVRVHPKSRNPGIVKLANLSLVQSDNLSSGCYSDFNID